MHDGTVAARGSPAWRILDAAGDGVLVVDAYGSIMFANRRAQTMFGYGPGGMPERVEALVPPDRRLGHGRLRDDYGRAPRLRQMGSGLDLHACRRDGSTFPVEVSLSPLGDGQVVAVVRDVTRQREVLRELRRRTKELEAANAELEAFGDAVSHDLRAPLVTLSALAGLLAQEMRPRQGASFLLDHVERASRDVAGMLEGLEALSRVGSHPLRREAVDLSAVARRAVRLARREAVAREVAVDIEDGCRAEGDPALLAILLQNLVGNAWKFTRDVSDARIAFGAEGEAFYVRDNGPGFAPDQAGALFEPFRRLHHPEDFEGRGIGLSTCRRIVRRHGGRIWAEGMPGQGATFWFTLA